MLNEFIDGKLKTAKYRLLKDKSYFGEIPGLKGVWANAKNLEDCRQKPREVLEDWLLLKIHDREMVPGFELKIDNPAPSRYFNSRVGETLTFSY